MRNLLLVCLFIFTFTACGQNGDNYSFETPNSIKSENLSDFKHTKLLAESGDSQAQLKLSTIYYSGKGVPKNKVEGLRWMMKAAESGADVKQIDLLQNEMNLIKNLTSFERDKLFAEAGDISSQHRLVGNYLSGTAEVSKNIDEALKWLRVAAEQGSVIAQNQLGFMYLHGREVEKNKQKAHYWYSLAAAQGDEKANRIKVRLEREGFD